MHPFFGEVGMDDTSFNPFLPTVGNTHFEKVYKERLVLHE